MDVTDMVSLVYISSAIVGLHRSWALLLDSSIHILALLLSYDIPVRVVYALSVQEVVSHFI